MKKLLPFLLLACLVPALVVFIYLSCTWDTVSRLKDLPVALANADRGVRVQGQDVNVGRELVGTLLRERTFRYLPCAEGEHARQAVRRGDAYFALILPEDLSRRAMQAQHLRPAEVELYVAEGMSNFTASLARTMGLRVAATLNRKLNEKRWEKTLAGIGQASDGLAKLKQGVGTLRAGAHQLSGGVDTLDRGFIRLAEGTRKASEGSERLAKGAASVATGVGHLTEGMEALSRGVRLIESKLPAAEPLERLAEGSRKVSRGNRQLANGMALLAEKTRSLHQGVSTLTESPLRWVLGARGTQLKAGVALLAERASASVPASAQLASGAEAVAGGVQSTVAGMRSLKAGMGQMSSRLPESEKLRQLSQGAVLVAEKNRELSNGLQPLNTGTQRLCQGTARLNAGADRLAKGLDTLYERIPASKRTLEGDPEGLAASVRVEENVIQAVPNSGTSGVPFFASFGLWLGAMIATAMQLFLLPSDRVSMRLTLPLGVGALQAILVGLTIQFALGAPIPAAASFYGMLVGGSLAFVSVLGALAGVFKIAGLGLGLLLLILQFVSSGGNLPPELSPPFFFLIHPWLPVTSFIKGLRAAMFGSYDGDWLRFLFSLGAFVAVGLLVAAIALSWPKPKPETE